MYYRVAQWGSDNAAIAILTRDLVRIPRVLLTGQYICSISQGAYMTETQKSGVSTWQNKFVSLFIL
jgi:hypothetical protein